MHRRLMTTRIEEKLVDTVEVCGKGQDDVFLHVRSVITEEVCGYRRSWRIQESLMYYS
jgi:hypothetical protein